MVVSTFGCGVLYHLGDMLVGLYALRTLADDVPRTVDARIMAPALVPPSSN